MPTTKHYRRKHKRHHKKAKGVPKYAKGEANRKLVPSHAMYNSQYAIRHRLPMAPAFITELDAEYVGVMAGNTGSGSSNSINNFQVIFNPANKAPFYMSTGTYGIIKYTYVQSASPTQDLFQYRSWGAISTVYARYRFLGTKVSVEICPSAMTQNNGSPTTSAPYDSYMVCLAPYSVIGGSIPETSLEWSNFSQMCASPWATSKMISNSSPASGKKNIVTNSIKTHDLFGVPKRAVYDEDDYQSSTTGSIPSNNVAYQLNILTDSAMYDPSDTVLNNNYIIRIRLKSLFCFDVPNNETALGV